MRIAVCPRCRSQVDISAFPPGGTFSCGGCGTMVKIPEAPPRAVAPVVRPPVAPVMAILVPPAPAAPPVPARAPAPPKAPVPSAPRTGPASSSRETPPRRRFRLRARGNPGLLAAASVGGLVLVAVLCWLAFGGSSSGGSAKSKAAKETAAKAAPVPAREQTPLEKRAAAAGMEAPRYLEMLDRDAAASVEGARESWRILREVNEEARARKVLDSARKRAPDEAWVNEALGLRNRKDDIRRVADDEEMSELLADQGEFQKIHDLRQRVSREAGAGWLDDAASANLDGWIAACRKRMDWLKDPANARSHQTYRNMKLAPGFEHLSFDYRVARPFQIFVEEPEAKNREDLDEAATRRCAAFQCAYREFLGFLRKDLGLQAPRIEDLNDTRLRVFLFKDRKSFDQWHLDTGQNVPPRDVIAYYAPVTQLIVMYHSRADAVKWGDSRQSVEIDTCIHEATHLLFDFYQRYFCAKAGKRLPEGEARFGALRVTPDTLFWFQEGLADYFGAAEPVPGKTDDWTVGHSRPEHLSAIAYSRGTRQDWKISEFLFADQTEIYERANLKGWKGNDAESLKALVYSHGWLAVHYFLNGESGKWRKPFLEYVRREITGAHMRVDVDSLRKDFPEFGKIVDANPAFTEHLRQMTNADLAWAAILQKAPDLAKIVRATDFLASFGLPGNREDPCVATWLAQVQAGFAAHLETLSRTSRDRR